MSAFFLSFRNQLAQNFPALFTEGSGDEPTFDLQTQFGRKWGWYGAINQIAGGDLLKFEEVTRLPARTCLTYLEYELDKNQVEKSLMKKNSHQG